jgi:hypothetical protein
MLLPWPQSPLMTSQKLFNNFAKEINIKLDPLWE